MRVCEPREMTMTARELQNVSKHLSKTHRERGAAFVWPAYVQQAERIGRLIVTGKVIADDAVELFADHAVSYSLEQESVLKVLALFREAEKTRESGKKPNGDGKHVGEGKAVPELEVINIRAWQGVEPKQRAWIVRNMIPARNVTLLTGQGGVGKTLLMQQMSAATVLGKDWVGELPEPGPVLFITAEDDEDEMHHRYFHIARHYGVTFGELADAGLHLASHAGRDATMAIADARGIVRPTPLFESWLTFARKIKPRWVGLDTAADIFVVNERDRSQVRQCISLLRGACLELDCAIILLAHPSLSGIASGSGLSGSTAWNNSVCSRLYLKSERKQKPKDGDDANKKPNGEDDEDEDEFDNSVRILECMKS